MKMFEIVSRTTVSMIGSLLVGENGPTSERQSQHDEIALRIPTVALEFQHRCYS